MFPLPSVLDASGLTSRTDAVLQMPSCSKTDDNGRNSTLDYDLSHVALASVSRHHAALGEMVTIRSELAIRHLPLAGPRVPPEFRVQELASSDSAAAKKPMEIGISQSFTFCAPSPTHQKKKERRDWNSNSVSCSTYFLEPQSV